MPTVTCWMMKGKLIRVKGEMKAVEDANRWQTKSLRDLATINYGRSPSEILADDGVYPVVGTGGSERRGNDYLHDGESIILGRKGTIDRVYFATGRFWTIDTAYYLTDFTESVPRWLYYFLQTIDLRQMNEATGVPSLSRELLYKIEIPTPPKPEQTKIAEVFSTVDRAIEQTEALIAKQQRIKTGLMQDLLTRGIDEHGNLRSEQTHQFKDSPLGRIPVEWDVASLQSMASKDKHSIVDGPFGSNLKMIHYRDSGVPIIQSGFVTRGVFAASNYLYVDKSKFKSEIRSKAVPGDIVMAKIGARCGMSSILPDNHPISIIAGNCIKVTVSEENSNKYVLACL